MHESKLILNQTHNSHVIFWLYLNPLMLQYVCTLAPQFYNKTPLPYHDHDVGQTPCQAQTHVSPLQSDFQMLSKCPTNAQHHEMHVSAMCCRGFHVVGNVQLHNVCMVPWFQACDFGMVWLMIHWSMLKQPRRQDRNLLLMRQFV